MKNTYEQTLTFSICDSQDITHCYRDVATITDICDVFAMQTDDFALSIRPVYPRAFFIARETERLALIEKLCALELHASIKTDDYLITRLN